MGENTESFIMTINKQIETFANPIQNLDFKIVEKIVHNRTVYNSLISLNFGLSNINNLE